MSVYMCALFNLYLLIMVFHAKTMKVWEMTVGSFLPYHKNIYKQTEGK